MEWGRAEAEEKAFNLKKTIYFQRGQVDLDPEHSVQYAYLRYVPILYAKECEIKVGEDPKGFSLGWWGPRKEAPLVDWFIVCSDK